MEAPLGRSNTTGGAFACPGASGRFVFPGVRWKSGNAARGTNHRTGRSPGKASLILTTKRRRRFRQVILETPAALDLWQSSTLLLAPGISPARVSVRTGACIPGIVPADSLLFPAF